MGFFEILNTVFIGPIKLLFETIFSMVNEKIFNPGISIIFLSLAINVLVLPLYMRADIMQKKAHEKENQLKDGIAHIKKSFKGDERMMILQTYYRQNDYSPFSALQGSVSLLLQIPFFMAAVQVLSNLPALEGASLGPISNLAAPDGLIVIGGVSINLLPILMTVVNFVSSAMFSNGHPLKSKIQLYGMAIFFLIFLYNYPAGLVFYWLLNNVFSLVKTFFYKLKNPKLVLRIMLSVIGAFVIVAMFAEVLPMNAKRIVVFVLVALALQLPLVLPIIKKKLPVKPEKEYVSDKKIFALGSVFLTALTGLLIPSAVIASSPQEFLDTTTFYSPLWYIVGAVCLAVGTFLVWLRVFYWLASEKGKFVFDRAVWILCGVSVINYMFFGTDLGNLSAALKFDTVKIKFTAVEQLINLAVVCAVAVLLYLIAKKKFVKYVLITVIIAVVGMSGFNMVNIQRSVSSAKEAHISNNGETYFELSKTGQNVVVIMLDRAMSIYVPYIMEERPELKEKFAGFTNYANTISFSMSTKTASPALLGGYEYTPVELNKRDTESLKSKHNEAHLVMPVLFSESGFKTTVIDPIYLNYQHISDMSVFEKYPEIKAMKMRGNLYSDSQREIINKNNQRNFFCYSLMKTSPLALQTVIYNNGYYNQALLDDEMRAYLSQKIVSNQEASGINSNFRNSYTVLDNLGDITQITDDGTNTFMFMMNDATHQPTLLQLPDYTPQNNVDNTGFELAYKKIYELGDKKLSVETPEQLSHYHINMASFIQIGEWLDYLRENDVYDNTRIIIASDHGFSFKQDEDLLVTSEGKTFDMQAYAPLLMVKDFNATEFTTSDEFMTNADVISIATDAVIENPVNPFTNKAISNKEKYNHAQYILNGMEFDVLKEGNTFEPSMWIGISDSLWDSSEWEFYNEEIVLQEHSLPNKK